MLESGSSGSVRGASSNGRPYREPRLEGDVQPMIRSCASRQESRGSNPLGINDEVERRLFRRVGEVKQPTTDFC